MRTTLMSQPEGARKRADYENVIRAFKSVHLYNPAYVKSPLALEAVGELQAEMGRRFRRDEHYVAALDSFRHLITQYPQSSMARDAQFTIAEICRANLYRPEEALKAFQDYLQKYPRSAKANEARAKLKEIEAQIIQAKSAPAATAPLDRPRPAGLPEVTAIRRWVGPNYTRIVVNIENEVKFESSRVPNPDRIVLDLQGARLSSSLVGKTFPVENGFLRQVRIGQFQPTVTRVVLDVEKIEEYSVFTLPNPFRLVVDINGPPMPATEAEAASPPQAAETKAKESKRPEPERAAANAKADGPAPESRGKPERESSAAAGATSTPTKTREPARAMPVPEIVETASAKPREVTPAISAKRETALPPKATKGPAPTESGSRTLTRALGLKIARIVIDPGHGGHDTGTVGPTGLTEKELVLDVGLRLKKLLEEKTGAEVLMTRTDDTFIPLEERTAIANEKNADLFVSIHANASRDRRARGIETYYLNFTSDLEALEVAGRENATSQESVHQLQDLIKKIALSEKIEESQDFATQVQREVYSRLRKLTGEQRNRGVKKAPFVVLIGANMPSILTEISFLTNPKDERLLKRAEHREQIAEALHRGISRYANNLGGVKVTQQAARVPGERAGRDSPPSGASNF